MGMGENKARSRRNPGPPETPRAAAHALQDGTWRCNRHPISHRAPSTSCCALRTEQQWISLRPLRLQASQCIVPAESLPEFP